MQFLMLMWADADAASGDESDFQAWATFDEQVKAAGAFVMNGALTPAASDARLVRTAIVAACDVTRSVGSALGGGRSFHRYGSIGKGEPERAECQ